MQTEKKNTMLLSYTLNSDAQFTNVTLVKKVSSGWVEPLSNQPYACMWMGEDLFLCGLSAVAETSLYMVSYYQNLNLLLIYLTNLKLKLTFKDKQKRTFD